jgi:hypothetical protein
MWYVKAYQYWQGGNHCIIGPFASRSLAEQCMANLVATDKYTTITVENKK